ncbi:uncharacterized protein MCYG_06035 [Microsporum canis CBS 113480]|uniref:Uncharacterized protein n=1 Tax=Arthroderma otae (strain ATCC MYA-4605 / CBS 113480) TaxID=554155 RepID=C5FTL3_ARTOC|nr:uncharacterized protein MCYG_06035 [Microsporum canis CBS 113480]EEQ33216.1 predicted protein [Microsporum canis CBS 113480]
MVNRQLSSASFSEERPEPMPGTIVDPYVLAPGKFLLPAPTSQRMEKHGLEREGTHALLFFLDHPDKDGPPLISSLILPVELAVLIDYGGMLIMFISLFHLPSFSPRQPPLSLHQGPHATLHTMHLGRFCKG